MLVTGLMFTYKFATELEIQAEARQAKDFHERTQRATTAIVMRMKRYEAVLRGAAGLFSTGTEVTAARWDDYVSTLDLRSWLPGVRAMSFIQAMGPSQVAYQQSLIRYEQPDFVIRPTPTRTAYVVRYSGLNGVRTRGVLGIDLGADPARLKALQRACRTGQVALTTSAAILLQDRASRTAAIMFYPAPRAGVPGLGTGCVLLPD